VNHQIHKKKPKRLYFSEDTINKCEKYAIDHYLNFSSVIQLATSEYFIGMEGWK